MRFVWMGSVLILYCPRMSRMVVYRGDWITDENAEQALFGEMASNPSSMASAKANDAYGSLPGFDKQYSDAIMAYPQSWLGGDPCYVRLPKELA